MERSFVPPAAVARIHAAQRRGVATLLDVGPTVQLVLYRESADGATEALVGAKTVHVEYAGREAAPNAGPAGGATESEGTFTGWAPWDVRREDRFVMPVSGTRGRITVVEEPANGAQRAGFALTRGA